MLTSYILIALWFYNLLLTWDPHPENPFAEIIDEDDARVEYELDSDDETFLGNYNRKMENDQKEALKLNNEAFEHIVDVCEKEAFKLVLNASQI